MKIGILTQHFLRNYGGIIQNWALQQVLMRLGHEPLTFEHDTCYSRCRWLMRSAKHVLINKSLSNLPEYPYKGRVGHPLFIDFITNNIRSVTVRNFTSHTEKRFGIDAFLVGSDQVWRPTFNLGRLYNMYLDFASESVVKVAYAASFGVSDWEYTDEETEKCKHLINRFHGISVREDSGVKLCRRFLGKDAQHVLDPTLLLDKENYMQLCKEEVKTVPCVFVYALHLNKDILQYAEMIAVQKCMSVSVLQAGDKLRPNDSIEHWVAFFRDADYVVTDSFHGMAFAIIFNKPFYVFLNESGGVARYMSTLKSFGLENRIIHNPLHFSEVPIDWKRVNAKRNELRTMSVRFLEKSLS